MKPGERCSYWARVNEVDPVGTAGDYLGYLLVEWPLPWPQDVAAVSELKAVEELLHGRRTRLQALVPTRRELLRVALYERVDGAFSGYVGRAVECEVEEMVWRDSAVVRQDRAGIGASVAEAAELLLKGEGEVVTQREVLVCTHGRRDRCCGSMGTELFQSALVAGGLDGVRLGRTSHTGGHRFAPTAVVLPEGTLWGYLDSDALRRVAHRKGPLDDLLPRFRGSSGLGVPAVQALERSVLAEIGWTLFSTCREAESLGTGMWRLSVSGLSERSVWEGRVLPGRSLPVPRCGAAIETVGKFETEFVVTEVHRVY